MKRLAIVLLLFVMACGKKDGGGGDSDVKWPAKPANGSPLAIEFVALKGTGDDISADMRLFNFEAKPITGISLELHYQGADGKDLKTFPWGAQAAPYLVDAKGTSVKDMGAFIPAEAKTVSADIHEVTFKDGTKWTAPAAPTSGGAP